MPTITAQGKTIICDRGANLRRVLLKHGIALYNHKAKLINCRGIGSCGTCAVEIERQVCEPNWKDKARRSLPPHSPTKNRRFYYLYCNFSIVKRLLSLFFDDKLFKVSNLRKN